MEPHDIFYSKNEGENVKDMVKENYHNIESINKDIKIHSGQLGELSTHYHTMVGSQLDIQRDIKTQGDNLSALKDTLMMESDGSASIIGQVKHNTDFIDKCKDRRDKLLDDVKGGESGKKKGRIFGLTPKEMFAFIIGLWIIARLGIEDIFLQVLDKLKP